VNGARIDAWLWQAPAAVLREMRTAVRLVAIEWRMRMRTAQEVHDLQPWLPPSDRIDPAALADAAAAAATETEIICRSHERVTRPRRARTKPRRRRCPRA
jgi:hypothetical protein